MKNYCANCGQVVVRNRGDNCNSCERAIAIQTDELVDQWKEEKYGGKNL
jgi:hypothetical protein